MAEIYFSMFISYSTTTFFSKTSTMTVNNGDNDNTTCWKLVGCEIIAYTVLVIIDLIYIVDRGSDQV